MTTPVMTTIPYTVPNTSPYYPQGAVPMPSVWSAPGPSYIQLDPSLIAAISRLATAIEKFNERGKSGAA